ncbi:MAG: glycoside hydrolase family 5 protein [Acidimicrobiia bacterium]|nr:glycoside hydrolase family 5 protein [Acidimicrobiia bacterium]
MTSIGTSIGRTSAAVLLLVGACTTATSEPTTTTDAPDITVVSVSSTTVTDPTTTVASVPAPEHRIQVRVIDGAGEFYDTATMNEFVPRGMNYNRFVPSVSGPIFDSVLATTRYEPATVDADFTEMRSLGFNVVRIMLETCGVYVDGCITGSDGRLNPEYMDNVVDFLNRAKAHDLFVMVASNTLPGDSYWLHATAALTDAQFDSANNEFLNPRAVPIYVDYWESVVQALVERGAPLDVIWGYELRQEHHFHEIYAPLSLTAGLITTANGETYDMSSDDDKNRMVDEGLVYWADTIRRAIREIDPTALVTVGFFTPNEPNPVNGPDETRLVRTAYFLRNSEVDFADLHHYRGNGVDDADIWENFGIAGVDEMPLVLGEHGGFRNWYSSIDRAATAVMGLEVDSCRQGFDGWLVWAWRGDASLDLWWANEGSGNIARVVAPINRPDPCAYAEFDFIRYNVALESTVTASSEIEGNPATNVNDGTPKHWNASALAPQWVELALANPTDLTEIVLTVAQDPPGRSVHELWVRKAGADLRLIETFDGVTAENDRLVFSPGEPLLGIDLVRVVSTSVGDLWPAWHEIELLTADPPP